MNIISHLYNTSRRTFTRTTNTVLEQHPRSYNIQHSTRSIQSQLPRLPSITKLTAKEKITKFLPSRGTLVFIAASLFFTTIPTSLAQLSTSYYAHLSSPRTATMESSSNNNNNNKSNKSSGLYYPPPTVIPASGKHSSTVIFLHGLGGTGMNYELLVRPIGPMFPHVKIILPTAPVRRVSFLNQVMNSWYDIHGASPEFNEDDEGLKQSTKVIHDLIDKEEKAGIPSDRILIAGASQGGALALYSGLTCKKSLAGILALSTYLPLSKTFPGVMAQANKDTPILMCHGEADTVVDYKYGKMSYDLIRTIHNNIVLKSYPNMGHTGSFEEMMDVMAFLSRRLQEKPQASVVPSTSTSTTSPVTSPTTDNNNNNDNSNSDNKQQSSYSCCE